MIEDALRILEFGRALEHVAGFAATGPGRQAVLSLRPSSDGLRVAADLEAVAEVVRFEADRGDWMFPSFPDARATLDLLQIEGSLLPGEALVELRALLESGRLIRESVHAFEGDAPRLGQLVEQVFSHEELEGRLARSLDEDGNVTDTASRELGRIRARLKGSHNRVVRHLEGVLDGVDDAFRVQGASVTIREGRYVIPLRKEGKAATGGYVHDESASGATVFVEPPSAIMLMNEVRSLEREEIREVQRILGGLTEQCRTSAAELTVSLQALTELDSRRARARVAGRWGGHPPAVIEAGLVIKQGRHPLLLAAGVQVVPFDLELEPGERVVIVSGPNTGGKTVFLKSVGLIAALAQSGVIPPVDKGTCLPVFDSFYADVGDGQSLSQSLSTFSAHLGNLKEMLEGAGPGSLVLVDELGTGTDPKEGEALARAIVESLENLGSTAIVTSHLGGLKRLAKEGGAVLNASLQFDPDQLGPTYQFLKGRPGRSFGLAIARGLEFPEAVLDLAERYRDDSEARVDELLESLETKEREAATLAAELLQERDRVNTLQAELDGREKSLRAAERNHEDRARADARRLLLDARAEVEQAIANLEAHIAGGGTLAQASKEARRAVETAARSLDQAPDGETGSETEASKVSESAGGLAPGARVRMTDSGAKGTVLAVEGRRVVVDVAGVRLHIPKEGLSLLAEQGPAPVESVRASTWVSDVNPAPEVDLRGQRVDEAEASFLKALDDAVLGDLGELRVIHGKGTGALRDRVTRVLQQDGRVEEFRPGGPGEGGHGVTVVTLR